MTQIESISREEMLDLISSGTWGMVDEDKMKTIKDSLLVSTHLWIGLVDKDLICAFGVAQPSLISERAYFWVWATEKLRDHVFIFTRRSQMVVADLLNQFPTLFGFCDTSEPGAERWLRWLGAKFGPSEGDMIPFEIRRA